MVRFALMTEQSAANKLDINVGKNISAENNNVFAEDNTSKPNVAEVDSKHNITADNKEVKPICILFYFNL